MSQVSESTLRLASAWRVWERNFQAYRKRWMYGLLPNFFEPIFYLLGMGFGLGAYMSGDTDLGTNYAAYIAPGLIAASAMNGAVFESTYNVYVKMHFAKIYDAMITTRISAADVVIGEIFWAMTRALLYGVVFALVAFLFGLAPPVSLALIPLALLLIGFAFASLGMAFTGLIPAIDLYSYFYTMFLTPSFLFSGIFFPVQERFPAELTMVAQATPLYHSVQLIRAIVEPGSQEVAAVWSVLYLGVFGAAFTLLAVRRITGKLFA